MILPKAKLNALRFGIEWSRIEPEKGQWNQEAIDHYKKYIAELQKRGIRPVINLWHSTLPVWFDRKGGFVHRANIKYFVRFVERIAEELNPSPAAWLSLSMNPTALSAWVTCRSLAAKQT